MTLPHNTATAKVTIDGLAICCFTHRRQLWEVGYLRHNHHNHRLILDIDGDPNTPIEFRPDRGIVIRIETLRGISPYRQFPDGFFDQLTIADRKQPPANLDAAENFRWAINLEDPLDIGHGRGQLVRLPFSVTRAFIHDAVFYTQALPTKNLFRLFVPEDGATMSQQELDRHLFGKTNNVIGADITCAADGAVNVVIEDGHGHSQTIGPLPHRPGNPWQISLTNMRPELTESRNESESDEGSHGGHGGGVTVSASKPAKGDFQLYYDAFDLDDRRQQRALWGFPEPAPIRSGRTDCNTVWVGTSDNLDALF
jgi:hypothetical protein